MKCLKITVGVLVVILAAFTARFLMVGRPMHMRSVRYTDTTGCVRLTEAQAAKAGQPSVPVIGAEDVVPLDVDGLAIVSSNDNMHQWVDPNGSPESTPEGHLFLLDTRGLEPKLRVLPLHGFPKEIPFHPHGLYYSEERSRLFVVNHAYAKGGDRLELFQVEPPHAKSGNLPYVRYVRTVRSKAFDAFALGNLNDVVAPFEGELYVSVYRAFPDPVGGRQQQSAVRPLLDSLAFIVGSSTFVYRCRFEERAGAQELAECAVAADRMGMANGLAHSADGSELFVSDMPNWRLNRYRRDPDSGRLRRNGYVSLPHPLDNVELDRATGDLYGGAVPSFFAHLDFKHSLGRERSPGGSTRIRLREDGSVVTHDMVMQDGELLSGVSCGPKIGESIVLGSWGDLGVVVCPYKEENAVLV